MKEESKENVY